MGIRGREGVKWNIQGSSLVPAWLGIPATDREAQEKQAWGWGVRGRMRSVLGKELLRDYGLTLWRCPVRGQIHKSRAEGKSYIRDTDLGITCILIIKTLKINISQEVYEDERKEEKKKTEYLSQKMANI